MAGSVNKVILIGNLGRDPEIRSLNSGDKVANLSIATSESWKDKSTGERKEKTEWHRVTVFNEHIVKVCESYLKKGSTVYIEGQLQTRKYEKNGADHYATEIVLQRFNGVLTMLGGKADNERPSGGGGGDDGYSSSGASSGAKETYPDDSEIPFISMAGHFDRA